MSKRFARHFLGAAAFLLSGTAMAAGGGPLPFSYKADVDNYPSVQRGAALFMNYCSGCHSMKYLRYNRLAKDINIPEDLLKNNLMFTSDKPQDHILSSMPSESAGEWFGTVPPDLTLETRARGESWVYSYLKSFYLDESRPMGVNNLVLSGASMPNVFWQQQGWQKKAEHHEGDDAHGDDHGGGHGKPKHFEQVTEGTLSADEFDKMIGDLVNFMAYAAEPGRSDRVSLGISALFFLSVLTFMAWLLKKEFWRDVH